ncbi:MAG TPA: hypothetical protein VF412_03155 [Bdellovibrio sp.]|uniref:hypothetical protein n=1 Tax=Bdellovibrio sp. TaxID=28201 RepID=UPI002EE5B778
MITTGTLRIQETQNRQSMTNSRTFASGNDVIVELTEGELEKFDLAEPEAKITLTGTIKTGPANQFGQITVTNSVPEFDIPGRGYLTTVTVTVLGRAANGNYIISKLGDKVEVTGTVLGY